MATVGRTRRGGGLAVCLRVRSQPGRVGELPDDGRRERRCCRACRGGRTRGPEGHRPQGPSLGCTRQRRRRETGSYSARYGKRSSTNKPARVCEDDRSGRGSVCWGRLDPDPQGVEVQLERAAHGVAHGGKPSARRVRETGVRTKRKRLASLAERGARAGATRADEAPGRGC